MWAIKDKTGSITRCTVKNIEYNGTWMGDCYVVVTIESPTPVALAVGDYIEYRGERFEINYDPSEIKSAPKGTRGDAFKYEQVKFNSLADELTRCDFLDYVKEDNQINYTGLPSFSFFAATIQDLADRIQANLDRLYKDGQRWTVKVQPEYVNKTDVNIQVENKTKVWGALEYVNKHFGAYFVIRGRTITIGTAGVPTENLFRYGKGKGLATIKKQAESDQQIVTRLRVYGASDNLPARYYNKLVDENGNAHLPNNMAVKFLMLPGFPEETQDPYIDSPNIESLGIREGSVFFDGSDSDLETIKPSIEGMTAEQLKSAGIQVNANGPLDEIVEAEQTTDDGLWEDLKEGEEIPNFTITVKDLGFDINDHLTTEEAVISMKSGMLGARDFTIVKCVKSDKGYVLTCRRVYDEGLRLYFPYKSYNAKPGDKFVLLHIEMPDVYIKAASQRLLEAGKAYLEKNDYSRLSYSPEIDEIYMARQHVEAMASGGLVKSLHDTIKEGDIMLFDDEDLLIDNAAVVIDNLQIKEGDEKIPKYTVTLRNEKTVGAIQRLQNQIDSIVSGGGQGAGGYNAVQIRQMVFTYGKERFLSKLEPDVAQRVIRFLEGAEFGKFVSGYAGAVVDGNGNAEVESLQVRSWLKVFELIYNRLNALEGDTSFADVGTIDKITDNPDGTQTATMRLRWDGDFTAFQPGDVVYGYVNDLDNSNAKEFYKAWAWVKSVDRAANQLTLVTYPDRQTPAGKNHPMAEGMIISRWGNNIEPNKQTYINPDYNDVIILEDGKYRNIRQSSFYVSCDDGNLVELMGVNKPILERGNYGTVLGKLPSGLLDPSTERLINKDQPYLYARGVIVQDLIRIGYHGNIVRTANYRGAWSRATATNADNCYRSTASTYDTVTYDGQLWQLLYDAAPDEPGTSGAWLKMTDNSKSAEIWTIAPSAATITLHEDGTAEPEWLTCLVQKHNADGATTYTDNYQLYKEDMLLYVSLDGKDFVDGDETIEVDGDSDLEAEDGDPFRLGGNYAFLPDRANMAEFIMGKSNEPLESEAGKPFEVEEGGDIIHVITIDGGNIASHAVANKVVFYLVRKTDKAIMAHAVVNVVRDGAKGDAGVDGLMVYPAGRYDNKTSYASTDGTSPVVECDGQYYMLRRGWTYRGAAEGDDRNNPAKDYAMDSPDAPARWQLFDKFKAVFTDVLMADFAKLSSAVFYEDWMISQQGTINGEPSNEYQHFKDGSFVPNFSVNFVTGEINAASGVFSGSLLTKFKTLEESDATRTDNGGEIGYSYALNNDLKIISSGLEHITLPSGLDYIGKRVLICNNVTEYSRNYQTTMILTQEGSYIIGETTPSAETPTSGTQSRTSLDFITGSVELVAIPKMVGSSRPADKCDWMILSLNAKYAK